MKKTVLMKRKPLALSLTRPPATMLCLISTHLLHKLTAAFCLDTLEAF